jgi:hypothetical protein
MLFPYKCEGVLEFGLGFRLRTLLSLPHLLQPLPHTQLHSLLHSLPHPMPHSLPHTLLQHSRRHPLPHPMPHPLPLLTPPK